MGFLPSARARISRLLRSMYPWRPLHIWFMTLPMDALPSLMDVCGMSRSFVSAMNMAVFPIRHSVSSTL